jgi:hypothetical protein
VLTTAAIAYYCGEDTVRAGMALTNAQAASGDDDDTTMPALAVMLAGALQSGMPPSKIRDIIVTQHTATPQRRRL